jgi:hypothetical protein
MSNARPHPELWQPIATLLLALRALLRAADPGAFAALSVRALRELRLGGAMLRRYIFILAREIIVPPPRPPAPRAAPRTQPSSPRPRTFSFDPGEWPPAPGTPSHPSGAEPAPGIEWALALNRAEALLAALRDPLPLARRLALRLAQGKAPPLRELPVPAHILRAIPPEWDALLMRLDSLARPDAWTGMHPDTG